MNYGWLSTSLSSYCAVRLAPAPCRLWAKYRVRCPQGCLQVADFRTVSTFSCVVTHALPCGWGLMAQQRYQQEDGELSATGPLLPQRARGVSSVDDRRVSIGVPWYFPTRSPSAEIPEHHEPWIRDRPTSGSALPALIGRWAILDEQARAIPFGASADSGPASHGTSQLTAVRPDPNVIPARAIHHLERGTHCRLRPVRIATMGRKLA